MSSKNGFWSLRAASSTARDPARGPYLGIGVGILAVSTGSLFIRFALQAGVPSLVIAAYRLSLAALVLAPLGLARHRHELRQLTRRQWALALTSGVFLALHFGAWISSLAYTSVASSVVLVSSSPLFVGIISVLILREQVSRAVLVGLCLTLAGTIVVGMSDACPHGCPSWSAFVQGSAMTGDLLALFGAVAMAGYLSAGRALRSSMSLTPYVLLTYATAAAVLCAAVWVARLPAAGYSPWAYAWLALLALVPQLVGHTAFNWALKYLPATYVAVTTLGEPVGSTLLAAMLLGEVPGVLQLAGSGLILSGIIAASRRPKLVLREPN